MSRIRAWLATAALALSLSGIASAQAQILTVIDETGPEPVVMELTAEDVEALDQAVIATNTFWTEGTVRFSGAHPSAIAALIAGDYSEIEATALNDFSVFLPLSDFQPGAEAVMATRADDERLTVRDRGPFWLIFNFDALDAAGRTAAEQRSIWQLSTLVFR